MIPSRRKQNAAIALGIALILLGLVANQWVLTVLFSDDRSIQFSGKVAIIWVVDLTLITVGIWFVARRGNPKVSGLSANLLLFSGSTVVVMVILELLFPLAQRALPLEVRTYIPWPYTILSQSTKSSRVPEGYVAIFGDSYAEGAGDWYRETGKSSSDLLANALNKDVVTFGYGGASSISGIAVNPIVALRRLRYRVGIEDPKSILIYFYEGNDLEGNLTDLSRRLPNYFELMETSTLSEGQFHNYLDEAVLRTDGLVPPDVIKWREIIASKFIAAGFLWNATQRLFGTWNRPGLIADTITNILKEDTPEKKVVKRNERQNQRNVVDLYMGTTELPANLQGLALQLTEEERQLGITLFEYSLTYAKNSSRIANSRLSMFHQYSLLTVCAQALRSKDICGIEPVNSSQSRSTQQAIG